MKHTSSPLSEELAGLRAACAAQGRHVWMPAALHALIIACLVRIFGRLEHLVQQWQSGQLILPLPVTPAIRPVNPDATGAPRRSASVRLSPATRAAACMTAPSASAAHLPRAPSVCERSNDDARGDSFPSGFSPRFTASKRQKRTFTPSKHCVPFVTI